MTVAAMPWMADHEFPHMPDSGLEAFREPCEACKTCVFGARVKVDVGSDVALKRDLPAAGDPSRDVILDPFLLAASSLPSVAYISSSTEISRLVRGRSVDSEGPLAGFMACARRVRAH